MLISRSFRKPRRNVRQVNRRDNERGVTMVLVALCMMALIAMAALSIDVVTLYLNREEAQRSADAAALAAARVISISGITGTADPTTDTSSWEAVCGTSGTATQVAQQVGSINGIGGSAPSTPTVTYSAQGATGGASDCSGLGQSFAINPSVTVQVKRTGLPTLFSRIWSRNTNTVSATATAEVYNPSDSDTIAPGGQDVPVAPRCVKPFILADEDPGNAGQQFVSPRRSGRIVTPGIRPTSGAGVIGENFTLTNNCGTGATCNLQNTTQGSGMASYYVPALVNANPAIAVPSCATDDYQDAVAGCDESTVYACGTVNGAYADLTRNRGVDASTATSCLINYPNNDTLTTSIYPFQIIAGSGNPLFAQGQIVTASNSIITVPLFNDRAGTPLSSGTQPQVTIVGYLQLFVYSLDTNGDLQVTVLNVAGCGDAASTTLSAAGSSPVPIRLITPQ
jgi:Flp pilus assembly protein TadG